MALPTADSPSDALLARRAAGGDRDAFAAIYERYRQVVYRYARLMTGSAPTAEDVTQEVFVALIRALRAYEPARAGLATYLYGVVRNVTRNRLRRDRRFVTLEAAIGNPSTAGDPHAVTVRAQQIDRLRRAILALPSRYREIVVLCDIEGLAYAEAAQVLNAPVGTVRSRLSRARRMLAARLAPAGVAHGGAASTAPIERCIV